MSSGVVPPASRHKILDLFAGPGGLDVGAAWLGIHATGIELDTNACSTRTAAGLDSAEGDVRSFRASDFPGRTVLTGGPPCQTFTVAGSGSGRRVLDELVGLIHAMAKGKSPRASLAMLEDDRTGLVLEPLRFVLEALRAKRPYEAVVLEQVQTVLPIWEALAEVLVNFGYGVDVGVLRTEEFGVPQTRRRAILVARYADDVRLPTPTHERYRRGVSRQGSLGLEPWVSMGEALDRDEPFTVVSNYGSGGDSKKRGRRSSDQPSATVTGKVTRNRLEYRDRYDRLALHEAGMLQTFPRDFPWSGCDVGQQIGNAIPPRLAVHVLSAALGLKVDSCALDAAVSLPWNESRSGVLNPDVQNYLAG